MADKKSPSGIPLKRTYFPEDVGASAERPGRFPFTRGIHESMYRGRLWTMRQYAGYGTAEETNRRFRELLEAGQTGLSVAFDLPTQMGYDSDASVAEGEVGRAGVAIDTVDDLARLFDGIPLDEVSTSMTINATAAILFSMYVVVAEERGLSRKDLRGTIQNDILKEFIARGTYIYPVEPSLRLVTDLMRFVSSEEMNFNPISVSGYHMREAGATAVQEVAFTLADGLEYLDRAIGIGLKIDEIAPRISFFFAAHNDLFEEAAKFRAARRLWANLLRKRYGAGDRSCMLRFHTQTGGSTLTAQQPLNNIVRVAVQALAATLGGTQSLHTNSYDEALALPSPEAARVALRTQQILAHESGVAAVVDPLGGSYYVESLTDEIERGARELLDEIEGVGGAARAVERGYFQDAIAESAYRQQQEIESGRLVVVGVNRFRDDGSPPEISAPDYSRLASEQRARLADAKSSRDSAACEAALAKLGEAGGEEGPLVEHILEAVRARATLGEISDVMRGLWGRFERHA